MPGPTLGALLDEAEWAVHVNLTRNIESDWRAALVGAHTIANAGVALLGGPEQLSSGSAQTPPRARLSTTMAAVTKHTSHITPLDTRPSPASAQAAHAMKAAAAMLEGDTRAWPTGSALAVDATHVAVRVSRLVLQAADHALWNLPVQVHKVGVPTATSAAREWVGLRQIVLASSSLPNSPSGRLNHLQATPARLDGELPEVLAAARVLTHRALVTNNPGHEDITSAMVVLDAITTLLRPEQATLTATFWSSLPRSTRTLTPSSSGYRQAMEHVTARLQRADQPMPPLAHTAAVATLTATMDDLRAAWSSIAAKGDLVVSTRHVPSSQTGLDARAYLDARRRHHWTPLPPEVPKRSARVLALHQAQVATITAVPAAATPAARVVEYSAGITPTGITPT